MNKQPFILKFLGVTADQFASLDRVLKSEPLLVKAKDGLGRKPNYSIFAAIKTTKWDTAHGSLTIEVEIFPFQKWRQNPDSDPAEAAYKDDVGSPTPRWVMDSILDTLEVLERKAA